MRWMLMTMALICSSSWADTIAVSDAVIREPIPGRSMSAAFMTVHNAGEQVRSLVSAKADWAGSIELHAHTHKDGVMRMREVPEVEVPAKGQQAFASGGYHLMLMQLSLPLPAKPMIELCFADGECLQQVFSVEAMR